MVVNDIRRELFSKIIYFPISFFQKHSTGDIMSRFLNDISTLQHASSGGIRNGLRSIFEAVALLSIALYQNFILTSLSLIVAPLIGIAIKKTGSRIKRTSRITQQDMGSVSALLQEALVGIRSIKAFNGEKREHNRFAHNLSTYFASIMKCVYYEAIAPPIIEMLAISGCSIVLLVASHQVIHNQITPGQLTSLFAAMLLTFQPIKRIIGVYGDINYGLGAAQRVFAMLDEVKYDPHKQHKPSLPPLQHTITFDRVSFSYHEMQPILMEASITIKKGDRVGIIGPSGIGKSTVSDLILKFIKPTAGRILFDEHDINLYSSQSLRKHIGYVGQHPFLFNDTVYANVAYGNPQANMEEIVATCQLAHADEFIQKLPDQYQTSVGENGKLLSGGQKQRITIARALLKQPSVLIFDEPTSSLDRYSEEMIQQTIIELDKTTTVIVISHRQALLADMQRIFTIKHHQLVETQSI